MPTFEQSHPAEGQMGTEQDEVFQLWHQFDEELKKAGLTGLAFAKWYFGEIYDSDDEKALQKFSDAFKKRRNRRGTTPRMRDDLKSYLKVLHEHPDYKSRVDKLPARLIKYPEIDEEARFELKKISRMIDENLLDAESTDE